MHWRNFKPFSKSGAGNKNSYHKLRRRAFDEKQSISSVVRELVSRSLEGIAEFAKSGKRRISLVDQISFLVMQRRNLDTAFAFDIHFKVQGFHLFD